MIEGIRIKNYALISELEVTFHRGFNVLTGETGAGKSILIGALGLLLGGKGTTEIIRDGESIVEVSGVFTVETKESVDWLSGRGITPEDARVVIRRQIRRSGGGTCYIGGAQVTRGELEEFTSMLVDVHGQHEHQSLLSLDNQRRVLDNFSGCTELDELLFNTFIRLTSERKKLDALISGEAERHREVELLEHAVSEIDSARPTVDELPSLKRECQILSSGENLFQNLSLFIQCLTGEEGDPLSTLNDATTTLRKIANLDSSLSDPLHRWESALLELEDVSATLREYNEQLDFSPQRLEECEERLSLLGSLQKKYGGSIEAVLKYREDAQAKLDILKGSSMDVGELKTEIRSLEKRILELAGELSQKRKRGAESLSKEIASHLVRLAMDGVEFEIAVVPLAGDGGKGKCGPHGVDRIEFLIAPNRGEQLKPIRSIASGGEISRVMLAVKSVLAESDTIGSLVFDEIDVGIGGIVGRTIGEHLGKIGMQKQVLCITHLASIAAFAKMHIRVEKLEVGGRTNTMIHQVTGAERREEIARMLSGDNVGDVSLSHAKDLLERCHPDGY